MITKQQLLEEINKRSCLLWAHNNNLVNEKLQPIEFKKHKFLKDIYDDFTPVQAVRKASQIGFSVMVILKSLWLAKTRKYNIIYTLPTFNDISQFVPSKVNALINNNKILKDWTQDKDTVNQKQVDKGFIYYRGASASGSQDKMSSNVGIMLSADLLCFDECDRSDDEIMTQYSSRLSASDYKGQWFFSNPTSPNTLSQKKWEQSDQKHWFIKCEHCGYQQYLDYWKNVDKERKIFVCQKCKKEISDEIRGGGEWVKKYVNKDISGYWISHLMAPFISAKQIIESEERGKQYFYNFVLGLPYSGSDIRVTNELILKCIKDEKNNLLHNVVGVDVGLKKHYVLGNKQGIFKIGTAERWEDIENIMRAYDVETAVFDALPDLTEPRKIQRKYPGKVWLSYFKREVRSSEYIKWDYNTHTVYSDRSKLIQEAIDDFYQRKVRFNLQPEELTDYARHWGALYRTTEKDSLGIERDVWESSGDDHWSFAHLYFKLALQKTSASNIISYNKSFHEIINTF